MGGVAMETLTPVSKAGRRGVSRHRHLAPSQYLRIFTSQSRTVRRTRRTSKVARSQANKTDISNQLATLKEV